MKEEPACEHGKAWDVHCCGCHSGFLFDAMSCTCMDEGEDYGDEDDFEAEPSPNASPRPSQDGRSKPSGTTLPG